MKTLHVAPNGSDRWSGNLAAPNRKRTDGPLATIEAAQRAVRRLKGRTGLTEPVTVYVHGGTYVLDRPLVFDHRDGGSPSRRLKDPKNPWAASEPQPITYAAWKGEKPVISGGRRIDGWRETVVNGRRVWSARVPDLKAGRWYFRELWVNGRRAMRPERPRKGFHTIVEPKGEALSGWGWAGGQKAFVCAEGDIRPWKNLTDVEVVVYNYWIDSRMRIRSFDPVARLVELDRHSQTHLRAEWGKTGACYRVEGALEHLERPGEWCMDRRAGRVYYVPRAGERIGSVEAVAPALKELVRIEGEDAEKKPVELLRFEGLTFAHCEWEAPATYAASNQAANQVTGAVVLKDARQVSFTRCAVAHVGNYGIECATGCYDIAIRGCDITDLAAGGVKVWHGNSRITIADCEIAHGGRIHGQACGVLVGQSSGVVIVHNHIHDFHYTGISLGWRWGYAEGKCYGNVVEHNHVHDLGHGLLSDMGGIYTLGPQPGTRIRFNSFHDVDSRTYGGWGIYTDEGSTDILIESNIAYNTKCGGFHQHYGMENIVRNNIFAWSRENQLARSRLEPHSSFTFERNIVLIGEGLFWKGNWKDAHATLRNNLYWDTRFRAKRPGRRALVIAGEGDGRVRLADWQDRMGLDAGSLVADPGFVDAKKADFRLRKGSAAKRIGFIPIDLTGIGPRPEWRR